MNTAWAMRIVKSCGIDAVEFWDWRGKDIDAVNTARRELDMEIVAMCTTHSALTEPAQRKNYIEGLRKTIKTCSILGCKRIISQVGNTIDAPLLEQLDSIIDGLKQCAPILGDAGMVLVFEPLNTKIDHKGYYLQSSDEGAEIVGAVGSPYVKMLFDFYHQQITEGDITRRSIAMFDKIGHFHAAGNPGRHELDLGEINYGNIFKELSERFPGNDKYIGLEYFPKYDVAEGLRKLAVAF